MQLAIKFRCLDKTKTGFPVVFCHDVAGFINEVYGHRGADPSIIKFGADTGRGQFKVRLSIVDAGIDYSGLEHFKSTSVQKLLLLAATFDSREAYDSFEYIWNTLLGMQSFHDPFVFVGDLNIFNIILGLNSHPAFSQCCYCLWEKGTSRFGIEMRIFNSIQNSNEQWVENDAKYSDLKKYFNFLNQ